MKVLRDWVCVCVVEYACKQRECTIQSRVMVMSGVEVLRLVDGLI